MRTTILALVLGAASCSSSPPTKPASSEPTAVPDPRAARTLIASGAVVIDVRTPDEYQGGHVSNASNIPVDQFADRIAEVDHLAGPDKTKPLVVYCAAGSRAAKAKQILEAAGYTHVVNGGGFDDLQ